MIEYLSTKDSKPLLPKIIELARTKFCDELMYEIDDQTWK